MKKILPVLLVLALFLTLPVSAASGKLTAPAVSGEVGSSVTVTVKLDNPGIVAMRLFVRYDPKTLRLDSAKNGEVFAQEFAEFGKDLHADPYTLVWMDSLRRDNNTTSGTLCTLQFTILGSTASGETSIRFAVDKGSTFDVNLSEVAVADTSCVIRMPAAAESTSSSRTTVAPDATSKPADGTTQGGTDNKTTTKPSSVITQSNATTHTPGTTAPAASSAPAAGTSSAGTTTAAPAGTSSAGETTAAGAPQTVPELATDKEAGTANDDTTDMVYAAGQTDVDLTDATDVIQGDGTDAPQEKSGSPRQWVFLPALIVVAVIIAVLLIRKKKPAEPA